MVWVSSSLSIHLISFYLSILSVLSEHLSSFYNSLCPIVVLQNLEATRIGSIQLVKFNLGLRFAPELL